MKRIVLDLNLSLSFHYRGSQGDNHADSYEVAASQVCPELRVIVVGYHFAGNCGAELDTCAVAHKLRPAR